VIDTVVFADSHNYRQFTPGAQVEQKWTIWEI
jgi:hypothetical protein